MRVPTARRAARARGAGRPSSGCRAAAASARHGARATDTRTPVRRFCSQTIYAGTARRVRSSRSLHPDRVASASAAREIRVAPKSRASDLTSAIPMQPCGANHVNPRPTLTSALIGGRSKATAKPHQRSGTPRPGPWIASSGSDRMNAPLPRRTHEGHTSPTQIGDRH